MNARFISLAQPDPLSSRLLANLTFPLACFIVLSNLTLCPLQNSFLLFFFNYEIHRILLLSNILGFGFLFLINLFIYFWLSWIFVAAHGLSLVVASRGYSSLLCVGFSLQWLLLLWSTGSRHAGFSSCGSRALERRLSSCGARA